MKKLAKIGMTLIIVLGFFFMVTGCGYTNKTEAPHLVSYFNKDVL